MRDLLNLNVNGTQDSSVGIWVTICRSVLAWRLSNTMDAEFCLAALEEAVNCYGVSEIFHTDQGSQFTSLEFIQVLKDAGVPVVDFHGFYFREFWGNSISLFHDDCSLPPTSKKQLSFMMKKSC